MVQYVQQGQVWNKHFLVLKDTIVNLRRRLILSLLISVTEVSSVEWELGFPQRTEIHARKPIIVPQVLVLSLFKVQRVTTLSLQQTLSTHVVLMEQAMTGLIQKTRSSSARLILYLKCLRVTFQSGPPLIWQQILAEVRVIKTLVMVQEVAQGHREYSLLTQLMHLVSTKGSRGSVEGWLVNRNSKKPKRCLKNYMRLNLHCQKLKIGLETSSHQIIWMYLQFKVR